MDKRPSISLLQILLVCGLFFPISGVQAKEFRNSYIQFQLPDQWACYLANTAWVCRYAIPQKCAKTGKADADCQAFHKRTREAIIILTAKEVGPKDSLEKYEAYLKTPKTIIDRLGRRVNSSVKHLESPKIAGLPWVDGMHLGSEVPNFYTRYLATVKGQVAVLVTFSAHQKYYTQYSTTFFETIKSMRILQPKGGFKESGNSRGLKKPPPMGSRTSMDPEIFEEIPSEEIEGHQQEVLLDWLFGTGDSTTNIIFLVAFFLAGLGVFLWIRQRR